MSRFDQIPADCEPTPEQILRDLEGAELCERSVQAGALRIAVAIALAAAIWGIGAAMWHGWKIATGGGQ